MSETYEIRWRGETYHASDLTDEIKHKYCKWLVDHMLENAAKYKTLRDYQRFERELMTNPPEWTSLGDREVIASFGPPEKPHAPAHMALNRLILGIDKDAMTDDEFIEMVNEKAADPFSDFSRAMNMIKEKSDPKASRGETGLPRPKDDSEHTQASATSQSA